MSDEGANLCVRSLFMIINDDEPLPNDWSLSFGIQYYWTSRCYPHSGESCSTIEIVYRSKASSLEMLQWSCLRCQTSGTCYCSIKLFTKLFIKQRPSSSLSCWPTGSLRRTMQHGSPMATINWDYDVTESGAFKRGRESIDSEFRRNWIRNGISVSNSRISNRDVRWTIRECSWTQS